MEQRKCSSVPVALNKFLIYVFLSNHTAGHCWDTLRSGFPLLRYQTGGKERGKECKCLSNHGTGSTDYSYMLGRKELWQHARCSSSWL